MGADGGLSFCKVRDRATTTRLLSAFQIWELSPTKFSSNTSDHLTYLDACSVPDDYEWLEHGSFHHKPNWNDLADIMGEVDAIEAEMWEGVTLSDLLDDVATHPFLEWRKTQHWTLRFLWEAWGFEWLRADEPFAWTKEAREVLALPFRQWAQDLNRAVSIQTRWTDETWT